MEEDTLQSDESIQELEKPLKPTPIVVELEADIHHDNSTDLIINTTVQVESHEVVKYDTCLPKTPPPSSLQSRVLGFKDLSPYHWTRDMLEFYNDEKDDDDFDIEHIQSEMDGERSLWRHESLISPQRRKANRYQCFNCGQLGHDERECRPLCCVMCGSDQHVVKYCPKRMCLSCGKRCRDFVSSCAACIRKMRKKCQRCNVVGHQLIDCPDHWRRFHHITSYQTVLPPQTPAHKSPSQLWCCNCATRGHVEVNCPERRNVMFAPSSTLVSSYARAFSNDRADRLDDHATNNINNNRNTQTGKRKRYFEDEENKKKEANTTPSQSKAYCEDSIIFLSETRKNGNDTSGDIRLFKKPRVDNVTPNATISSSPDIILLDAKTKTQFNNNISGYSPSPGITVLEERISRDRSKVISNCLPVKINGLSKKQQKRRKKALTMISKIVHLQETENVRIPPKLQGELDNVIASLHTPSNTTSQDDNSKNAATTAAAETPLSKKQRKKLKRLEKMVQKQKKTTKKGVGPNRLPNVEAQPNVTLEATPKKYGRGQQHGEGSTQPRPLRVSANNIRGSPHGRQYRFKINSPPVNRWRMPTHYARPPQFQQQRYFPLPSYPNFRPRSSGVHDWNDYLMGRY